MRFSNSFIVLASIATAVQCVVVPASHVLHEKRDFPLNKWIKRDRVEANAILPIRIGLAQSNLEKGHDLLMGV